MRESVAIAKEADAKKGVSPTKSGDSSIHRVRNEPERQLGSLRSVIDNIRRDGGTPSVDSIATELSTVHTAQRASVLLALQRMNGNRYVQQVVAGIQAKLKVGQPGDVYEQEADRVADAVMRMPEPEVQRQVEPEEEEEETLQTKPLANQIAAGLVPGDEEDLMIGGMLEIQSRSMSGQHPVDLSTTLDTSIESMRGTGKPLTSAEREFFEPRFGYDFSRVRVHTGASANEAAKSLRAHAFTFGSNIAFKAGQYSPETSSGKWLLAHELTHVLQQITAERLHSKSKNESSNVRGSHSTSSSDKFTDDKSPSLSCFIGATGIQRDLARQPPAPGAVAVALTPEQVQDAIRYNKLRFEDPYTVRIIRDVLGLAPVPAIINEELVLAVVQWQAENNLGQDGKIGPSMTRSLTRELRAEGQVADVQQLRLDNFVRTRTVGARTYNDCSALPRFRWDVAFTTSLRNGWIIQRIDNGWNYNGPPTTAPTPRYWEAWQVDGTGRVRPIAATGYNDRWQRFFPGGSRGNWSMTGRLYTVLGLPATAGFGAGNVADAGILQSTTTAPNPDDLGLPEGYRPIEVDEPPRRIGGRWDCTDPNPANWFHRR